MTAKQIKKIQSDCEEKTSKDNTVLAFWSYKDSLENEHTFSAHAIVTEIEKDYINAELTEPMQENHHIIVYPKGWSVYLPKTTNPDWNINNRFEIPPLKGE